MPPTPTLDQVLGLDSKLGAAFLGCVFAAILYGITSLQTFIYYSKNQDSRLFRYCIYFIWVLDTAHMGVIAQSVYLFTISDYGNPVLLLRPNDALLIEVYISVYSDLLIRFIFGRRVWIVTGRNHLLAIAIGITALGHTAAGSAFAGLAMKHPTFAYFSTISWLMYLALACSCVSDILVASGLCFALSKKRTGFRKTDTLVTTLIMYAINGCLVTTLCAAACLISYAILPNDFIFIAFFFCLDKLYFNSLLSTLNGRESLQENLAGLSDIPVASGYSQEMASRKAGLPTGVFSMGPSGVVVTIDRTVDKRPDSRTSLSF